MRRIAIILASIVVLVFILLARGRWLSELERHVSIAKDPYYSQIVDLSREHIFTWKIENNIWNYDEGLADVFLVFERTPEMTGYDYWKKDFSLKVKINAYAITENKVNAPRLMQNYFFPTDKPMFNESKLWAGWSDARMEYRLGNVIRFPKEDLYIEMAITSPDHVLAKASPRLKIVGDYDPAVLGHITIFRLIRDVAIIVSLLSLGFLIIQSWRSGKSRKNEHERG